MLGWKINFEEWSVLERFNLAWSKFSEAWTSCMVCMVGGDFTVLNFNHAITASKTGAGSAVALLLITLFTRVPNRWAMAWLTAIIVALIDFTVHGNHADIYGNGEWREAIITGAGAALLGLFLSKTIYKGK